jgi:ribonuclease BN (tRNA processing enzyme)
VIARVWGCRGSLPTPGEATVRYGGNTSCVEIRRDGRISLILDAGTGIKRLGAELDPGAEVHVLLTHLHLDHVEGLRFFAPLWRQEGQVHIWGPPSPVHSLEERIARSFSPPLFPVDLGDIPAAVSFHDVPDGAWELDGIRILALPVSHPGSTVGFRLEHDETSLAFIPDHEPVLGVDLAELEPEWISGHAVADGVDVLLHDSQYSETEYADRVGWGHSSVADAGASCSSTTTPTAATRASTAWCSTQPSCGTATAGRLRSLLARG